MFLTRVQIVFCLHIVCFNSYRLADHPHLSDEFAKHLKRLTQGLSTNRERALYRRLIDTYGTHYIHQVRGFYCNTYALGCLFGLL